MLSQIHDWKARANAVKNPDLKYLGNPHVWQTAPGCDGNVGIVYKDRHGVLYCLTVFVPLVTLLCSGSKHWYGANGVPNGRPVDLFATGAVIAERPDMVPRSTRPFSDSAIRGTTKVRFCLLLRV